MKHITVINSKSLQEDVACIGCGECQTSCQSAAKTETAISSQKCVNKNRVN
jgi:predicted ribosomally synthesized six-cysteine peptide SCIFF